MQRDAELAALIAEQARDSKRLMLPLGAVPFTDEIVAVLPGRADILEEEEWLPRLRSSREELLIARDHHGYSQIVYCPSCAKPRRIRSGEAFYGRRECLECSRRNSRRSDEACGRGHTGYVYRRLTRGGRTSQRNCRVCDAIRYRFRKEHGHCRVTPEFWDAHRDVTPGSGSAK